MSSKNQKKKHVLLIILVILLMVPAIAALILMTHTQIIVGAIQKLSASTVNTLNLYEPLGEPMEGIKENSQYIITEVKYSDNYPNSFLHTNSLMIVLHLSQRRKILIILCNIGIKYCTVMLRHIQC